MTEPKAKTTRLDRAKNQRMYYMGRASDDSDDKWSFLIQGSSAKLYTVTIMRHIERGKAIKCNCMDHIIRKKNCKHILFVGLRVLKLEMSRVEDLAQGKTMNAEELAEIARNAGGDVAHEFSGEQTLTEYIRGLLSETKGDGANKEEVEPRKPEEGDDCPICFEDLTQGELEFCGYGCGKGVHKECFDMWSKAKRAERKDVTCVYCRSLWKPAGKKVSGIGNRGLLANGRLIDLGVHKSKIEKRRSAPKGKSKKQAKKTKAATKPKKKAGTTAKGERTNIESTGKDSSAHSQYVAPAGVRRSSRIRKMHEVQDMDDSK